MRNSINLLDYYPFPRISSVRSKSIHTCHGAAPDKVLGDTERALLGLRSLEIAIEAQYACLKKLVKKANTARKKEQLSWHCYHCGNVIYLCKKVGACQEDSDNFIQRVIVEGGPLCALKTKQAWKQLNSSLSAGGSSVVPNPECNSTYDHDYQHITNHHRELLKSLGTDLANIREWYRRVKYYVFYRWAELFNLYRGRNKKHIVSSFANFEVVSHQYEWVWRSDWRVENLHDMKLACKIMSKLQDTRIDQFNEMILFRSAVVDNGAGSLAAT